MRKESLAIFALIIFMHLNVVAEKISVGEAYAYKELGKAIASAKPHDTLEVFGSIFIENTIVIDKPLYILGINCPIIDGNKKTSVLLIQSDSVTVDGFELTNSGRSSIKDFAGIRVENSESVTITNCLVKHNYFGIYLLNSNYSKIYNNKIIGNAVNESTSGNGIHLWKCKYINVSGNETSNNRDGIYLEFSETCIVHKNFSTANLRYGLHFMFSNGNQYRSNRFSKNGSGVAVMYTHDVEMTDNVFEDNWGTASYGLLLKDISDSQIRGNKFSGNTIGIYMEGVTNVKVSKNDFESNGWAMKLLGNCVNDTISRNSFMNNTFDVVTNSFSSEKNSNWFNGNFWDRYEGYDLNKDKLGDVPFRPVSLFSVYVEKIPNSIVLLRTFLIDLLDTIERALPAIIPETMVDNQPLMKRPVL